MTTTPNTPAGGAVAWRVDWDDDDWHQYHDASDPLPPPDGWMDAPSRVVALYEAPPATVPLDAVLLIVDKLRNSHINRQAIADELEALTRGGK